jgi:hypothetical protein
MQHIAHMQIKYYKYKQINVKACTKKIVFGIENLTLDNFF